jgi:hypothetical protein
MCASALKGDDRTKLPARRALVVATRHRGMAGLEANKAGAPRPLVRA